MASIIIGLVGGLGVFLLGMHIMSEALQQLAGDRMRAILRRATDNRVLGVVTGLTVTSIVQSSSATTVMMVGFVNAGLLTLAQAGGIIMGANIGTTVTGWVVSLLGFKIKIGAMALPAIAAGFFARFFKRERVTTWGELLIGFGLLFLGLGFLKDALPSVQESPALAAWIHRYQAVSYLSTLAVIGVGAALTIIVQSSSAVMAVTLAAALNGLIDYPTGAALILGENIGTTVTALIASVGASRDALRAAVMHVLFNLFGVFWVSTLFGPFTNLVDWLVPGGAAGPAHIPMHLAMFHTIFNVTNTLLVLPFVHGLAAAATRLVPADASRAPRLQTVTSGFVTVPALSVPRARRRVDRMLADVTAMFEEVLGALGAPQTAAMEALERTRQLEARVDDDERQLNDFLIELSRHPVSRPVALEIHLTSQAVGEVERMGDHCERLAKLAARCAEKDVGFSPEALEEIRACAESLRALIALVGEANATSRLFGADLPERGERVYADARALMRRLREQKQEAQAAHQRRLAGGRCSIAAALVYLEVLDRLEEIGAHALRATSAVSRSEARLPAHSRAAAAAQEPGTP